MKRDQETNRPVDPLAELKQEISIVIIVIVFTEIIGFAETPRQQTATVCQRRR